MLVDGPVTDVPELAAGELPVFSRESTSLTTKRHASGQAEFGVPVTIGGVRVRPDDIVLGDDNGVLVLDPDVDPGIIRQAHASDEAEPEILYLG